MDRAVSIFGKSFRQHYNRLPVWLPGADLELGAVGKLDDGEFTKLTTLTALDVDFEVDEGDRTVSYDFASSSGVDITLSLVGETQVPLAGVPAGNVGIGFKFSQEGAFAFSGIDCRVDQMVDLLSVQRQMLAAYNRTHDWDRSWVVVTSLVTASRFAVAVSASASGEASLDLGVQAGPASLANASAGAAFAHRKDMAAAFFSALPAPVMYEAWRVDTSFFTPPHVEPVDVFSLQRDYSNWGTEVPALRPVADLEPVPA